MNYDIPLKELFHQAPQELLKLLTGSQAVELLNVEYPSIKVRKPDLVTRLEDGRIYHLELQTKNDKNMLWRMLEYYALIYTHYNIAPLQQVLYVGKAQPNFITHYQSEHLKFDYQLIDIRDIDCCTLLQSPSLEDNVLAVLCRLDDPIIAIRKILNTVSQLDDKSRRDILLILGQLANLRDLNPLLELEKQKMTITISVQDNIFARELYEQGEKEGEIKMLSKLLEKRFGKLPAKVKKKVNAASLEQLEVWTDRLFEIQTLDELFVKQKEE